jgi:hypothetical protein
MGHYKMLVRFRDILPCRGNEAEVRSWIAQIYTQLRILIFHEDVLFEEASESLHFSFNPFSDSACRRSEQLHLDEGLQALGGVLPDALNRTVDKDDSRDQRLFTALIGFRPADPIRGSITGVLSEKHVQLGRMFLHMAHGVQEQL